MGLKRILVLHGPNLNLLGEREGDEQGRTLDELNRLIRARAAELGLEVKLLQSNHEGALVDALHAERRWADGILINPAALTHTSYVLREALAAVGKPALEVHLGDIRRRESWRRKSVIKDVCAAQVMGKGFDSYLLALQRFAGGDLSGRARRGKAAARPASKPPARAASRKTLGRKSSAEPASRAASPQKTIGPAPAKGRAPESARSRPATDFLTRALLRQKIAARLSGKVGAGELAAWARAQWQQVRRGAPAESGYRELLEESLQSLVLSALPGTRLSDDQLVDLMAQLDG